MPANLALRNWLDPAHSNIDADRDGANDPHAFCVVCTVIPEYDGKDDAAKVTGGTRDTGDDAIREWMYMRYIRKVEAVGTLEEYCKTSKQTEHG